MLEKEPSRRPASASEVLRELDEAALRAGLPASSGALATDPVLTRSEDPAGSPAASTRALGIRAGGAPPGRRAADA